MLNYTKSRLNKASKNLNIDAYKNNPLVQMHKQDSGNNVHTSFK